MKAGVPFRWFVADEVYGQNPRPAGVAEGQRVSYVTAIPCSEQAATAAAKIRADGLAALTPSGGWRRLSCGTAPRGRRFMTRRWSPPPAATASC
jgi:hypothetical protein